MSQPGGSATSELRRARPLLGTFVEIAVEATDGRAAAQAVEAAFAAVATAHRLMSFHDPRSDVSRLNRCAAAGAVCVHPWTFQVLTTAVEFNRRSRGLFDVAVAPVLQGLGLLPPARLKWARRMLREPTAGAIQMLPGRRVRFLRPGLRIDLGGIAKGFAVDRALAALRRHGATRGLVNAGGDLAAFGPPAHEVGIRDPRNPARLLALASIADAALASTGARFDPGRSDAVGGCAVIDPRTRAPVHRTLGAAVRAPTCMLADALTKLVMLAPERSAAILDRYAAAALRVGADGQVSVTSGWQDLIPCAA
jgi:thiamine biosynthesis lipoprotein